MKKKYVMPIIFMIVLILSNVSIAAYITIPTWSDDIEYTSAEAEQNNKNFLELESEAAILIEQNSGDIIYEHNIHEKLRPASVTKIMTILIIMEEIDSGRLSYDDKVPCSDRASSMGGSQIWLSPEETLTVNEMLKAICVVSANDCTVAMAEYLAGTEEAFVERMNEKAKQLGMLDTTFKNCHGIDEDGHVTSAYDIAIMSRELITKHPDIMKYTTIWMDSLRDGTSELVNTNKLVKNYSGATGLKTGSTSLALFNLSASATRDNLSLIAVIMRAPTSNVRFSEARKLLDYGFNNYVYNQLATEGEKVTNVEVQKGISDSVNLVYDRTAGNIVKKGTTENIETQVVLQENVIAPISKGQKLGEVLFKINGETIETVNLVSDSEIDKMSTWNMVTHIYSKWFNVLRDK